MTARASTLSTFLDGLRYRGREGHLSFIGHRLAGLGTLLFLGIHIIDTSWVYFWPQGYEHAVSLYRNPLFMLGEIGLVAAVTFHGVNGLKIILNDFFPHWWSKHTERQQFWRVLVVTLLLWLPAAAVMGNSLVLSLVAPDRLPELTAAQIASRINLAVVAIPIAFVIILGVLAFGLSTNELKASGRRVAIPARTFETWGWMFMRWSGVLLIPLVWIHVLIQDILVGVHAIDLNYVQLRWAVVGWQAFDLALLAFAFGHGMNGLRGIVEDYVHNRRLLSVVKWLILIAWIVITALGGIAIIAARA